VNEDRHSAEAPIVHARDILDDWPVFRGTRVPVDMLFEDLANGQTLDEILRAYREDVVRALGLARNRLAGSLAADYGGAETESAQSFGLEVRKSASQVTRPRRKRLLRMFQISLSLPGFLVR